MPPVLKMIENALLCYECSSVMINVCTYENELPLTWSSLVRCMLESGVHGLVPESACCHDSLFERALVFGKKTGS